MTLADITSNSYIFWIITSLVGLIFILFIYMIKQGIQAFKDSIKDIIKKLDDLVAKINKTNEVDVLQNEQIRVMKGDIRRLYDRTDTLKEDLNNCKLNSRNEKVSN